MRRPALVLALLAMSACAPAINELKPTLAASDKGLVWFKGPDDLVMYGNLELPDSTARGPAVVLMHGCSGLPHRAIQGWAPLLREWGYATFIVDSFSPRGQYEVCSSGAVSAIQRVPDAYAALAILSTHPRIDADRIALMGFSHGGRVATAAATDWARKYARRAEQRFRAILSFYPSCVGRIEQLPRLVVPLRIHAGDKDDWTPAALCEETAARYRAHGADIKVTVYRDAPHGFDAVGTTSTYLSNVLNGSSCQVTLKTIDESPRAADLGSCVRRGATSGYHGPSTEKARVNVRRQLAELLEARMSPPAWIDGVPGE